MSYQKYTVPRSSTLGANQFAVAHGWFGSYWGWIIRELDEPETSYDNYDWNGDCLFCNLQAVGGHVCDWTYSASRAGGKVKYHAAVFFQEGVSAHELGDNDRCYIGFYGYFDWRYYVPAYEPYLLLSCLRPETGETFYDIYLDCLLHPLMSDEPDTESFRKWELQRYSMEELPPKFFRDLWNEIFTHHQVAPDEPCQIEPQVFPYVCFYGTVEERRPQVSFTDYGWDGTPGDCDDCPGGPGGTFNVCGAVGKQHVGEVQDRIIDPSSSYPGTFYREEAMLGVCPGSDQFTYYNRNNPPWNGG